MRISDWSSDVCSSDLKHFFVEHAPDPRALDAVAHQQPRHAYGTGFQLLADLRLDGLHQALQGMHAQGVVVQRVGLRHAPDAQGPTFMRRGPRGPRRAANRPWRVAWDVAEASGEIGRAAWRERGCRDG